MKRRFLLAISLGICSLVVPVSSFAGKPSSCDADVNTVSVDILPSAILTPYNIVSDGGRLYQNINTKNNKITAGFQISNCSYDFTMNLFQSSRHIKVFLPSGETRS